jgi:hypothetical protein
MAESEAKYLNRCWETNTCPNCKMSFPERQRVGTGRKRDGGFCSLDCLAAYRKLELEAKLKLMQSRKA